MARPRSYDPEEVVDRAVRIFWERGYTHTSIRDLVEGTGVQRYGLYESFGGKHALFVAALKRYHEVWVTGMIGELESPRASVAEIRGFFERLEESLEPSDSPPGCLLCNTATELGGSDPDATAVVGRYVDRIRSAFREALSRARESGEVSDAIDPDDHASYLTGVVLGVSVYSKTPAATSAVRAFVDTALESLR